MPKKLSDGQIEALNEMLRRGTLTGDRAAAARELVRRHGKSERQRKLEEIERARNSGTGAFMTSFANAATLGLADRAVDLVNAGARALGLESMTREERRAMDEREAAENPWRPPQAPSRALWRVVRVQAAWRRDSVSGRLARCPVVLRSTRRRVALLERRNKLSARVR